MTLAAPADAADRRPTGMLAVSVTEPDPPAGKEPPGWMLTVSRGEPDPETVRGAVGWYEARWSIGEWFRVPRSGARIGDRQPGTADDLRKCLAFDADRRLPCPPPPAAGARPARRPRDRLRQRSRGLHPVCASPGTAGHSRPTAAGAHDHP